MTAGLIKSELKKLADPDKADILQRFFKTGKGEYAHGDVFLGVTVPKQRKIVRKFKGMEMEETLKLLRDKVHECRFCALLLMIQRYEVGKKEETTESYLSNLDFVNNWDLVDLSAPRITGDFFFDRKRDELESLLFSNDVWRRRVAMVSTLGFMRRGDLESVFHYAQNLIKDDHHLIHKASGWMLREAGKRDERKLKTFLRKNAVEMPRTMLRYAIERFEEKERGSFLNLRTGRVTVKSKGRC